MLLGRKISRLAAVLVFPVAVSVYAGLADLAVAQDGLGRGGGEYQPALPGGPRGLPDFWQNPVIGLPGQEPLVLPGQVGISPVILGPQRDPGTTQLPGVPRHAGADLRTRLGQSRDLCASSPAACANVDALNRRIQGLEAARALSPGCDDAAVAYRREARNPLIPAAVAATYDLACLGSLVGRIADPVATGAGNSPAFLTDTKALRAIGLLVVDGEPVCGALIRNDRTIVTARHCVEGEGRAALQRGSMTLQPIDGRPMWRLGSIITEGNEAGVVREDWAIVRIDTTDEVGAAEVMLKPITVATDATVIGYFDQHRHAVSAAPREPAWRRGLRWPRPGFCIAVVDRRGCLQTHCQTVTGFSGAPIFRSSTAAGAPLEVVGFVSGSGDKPETRCPLAPVGMTMAVSSGVIP